jgi:hypothetical protein
MAEELLESLEAHLAELGIDVGVGAAEFLRAEVQQATAHLTRGTARQAYRLLYGTDVRFADASRAHDVDAPTLLFTTYASPRTAATMRRAGVQYVDTAGNAWIEFGDVLIDVRGRQRPDFGARRPTSAGNLFSAGRAQVVLTLLAWPQLWGASRREVAQAAGVSVGQAHNALTLLEQAGYGAHRVHAHHTDLLDLWAAAFPTGLAPRLTLATYGGDVDNPQKMSADQPIFLSGASAIRDVLRPVTLTLYVETLDPRLAIKNRWRTDGQPNVVVRRKFWTTPADSSHDYDGPLTGFRNAPWPLVYADLLNSDDPRVRNEAKTWRDRLAGPDSHP